MKKSAEDKAADRARAARLKAASKERRNKLFEADPISHMQKISSMKDDLNTYYYWGSDLWRAIKDYIASAKDCVLMDLEGTIISHRGTGPSITMREASGYAGRESFSMTVAIEYFCDGEVGSYDPATHVESYVVYPPCELERNFTKKGFSAWIAKVKENRDIGKDAEDIAEYKRLKKKLGK